MGGGGRRFQDLGLYGGGVGCDVRAGRYGRGREVCCRIRGVLLLLALREIDGCNSCLRNETGEANGQRGSSVE